MNERLKQLRKSLSYTQEEFSKRIGIKRNTLANYEIGRNEPIDAVLFSICREFNVNEEWLRDGTGEMFIETDNTVIDQFVTEYDLNEIEKKMLEVYVKKLTKNQRSTITTYFKTLAMEILNNDNDNDNDIAATQESLVAECKSAYSAKDDELSATQEDYINNEVEEYRLALEAQAKAQKLEALNSIKSKNMA